MSLYYIFHTDAEGEPFYRDELLENHLEDRTPICSYTITKQDDATIITAKGQLFTKQQAYWHDTK